MKLELVWRNPFPVTKVEHTLRRVSSDELGAVYSITNPDLTQQFELIQGAARNVEPGLGGMRKENHCVEAHQPLVSTGQ